MKKTLLAVLLSAMVLVGAFGTLNTSSVELEAASAWGTLMKYYVPGAGYMIWCDFSRPSSCVYIYQPR